MSLGFYVKRILGRCHESGCWKKGMSVSYVDLHSIKAGGIPRTVFEYRQCEPHMHQQLTSPDSMPLEILGRCRTCIGERKVNVRRFMDEHGKVNTSYSPAFGGRPDALGLKVVDCPKCSRER